MKKLVWLLGMLCVYPLAVQAQQLNAWNGFNAAGKNGIVSDWLDRHITAQTVPLPWVTAVQKQLHKTNSKNALLRCLIRDGIAAQVQPATAPHVRERLDYWQQACDENHALPHFFVKALNPQLDVNSLSQEQVEQIAHFLKTGYGTPVPSITPQRVQTFAHYLVGVILPPVSKDKPRLHLLFNCYANEVYVTYDLTRVPGVPIE